MTALGLGTAQLGSAYGISNRGGRPSEAEAAAILERALEGGVGLIDTAPAYGEVEALLGRLLPGGTGPRIVTKTPPGAAAPASDAGEAVRGSVHRSLERLGRDRLDGLLVHHAAELARPGGEALARAMVELRDAGLIDRLGASVYDREELEAARARLPLELVQLPLNALDQRFARDGTLAELRREGVEVHVRSVFLQGLLLIDPAALPAGMAHAKEPLRRFHEQRRRLRLSPLEAAIGPVRDAPGVDVVLVGANSASELGECIAAMRDAAPVGEGLAALAVEDPELIDPRRWAT